MPSMTSMPMQLQALRLSSPAHINAPASEPRSPLSPKARVLDVSCAPWGKAAEDMTLLGVQQESSSKMRRGPSGQSIALDEDSEPCGSRLRRSPIHTASLLHALPPQHERIAALRAAANTEIAVSADAPLEPLKARRPAVEPPAAWPSSSSTIALHKQQAFREMDFIASRTRNATSRKSSSPLGGSTGLHTEGRAEMVE